jgi:prepilin-type N-terminal cleavage/methylation domain-containing protein
MKKQRLGLTLIELIVVVAILAILAMIVLPKLDGLQNNANHAAAAASVADTGKYLQTFWTMKKRYPDGWDSLIDGTSLVAAANPGASASGTAPFGKGLHIGLVSGTNAKLATAQLTANEVEALQKVGINTLYNWTAPDDKAQRPNDRFLTTVPMTGTPTVAVINSTSTAGKKIIDRIYRENQKSPATLSGNVAGGTTKKLLALGLGPQNEMIGKLMMEAPQYANIDASIVYGRNLVLFEIGGSDKPIFKAVIAADGDLLDDLTTYMSKDL